MELEAIIQGVSISDSYHPVGRSLTSEMVRYYIKANCNHGIEASAVIVFTLSTLGRAGENQYASFTLSVWNHVYDVLLMEWPDVKTRKKIPTPFFHDADDFALDFYSIMSLYFMIGAGCDNASSPAFRNYLNEAKINYNRERSLPRSTTSSKII
jgi:hypothetical protein